MPEFTPRKPDYTIGLVSKLKNPAQSLTKVRSPFDPLWKGPVIDGVTFSMLSRFLVCKERFRIAYIEGLRTKEGFNHRIEYGQMWHLCEEALAANRKWEVDLASYGVNLCQRYPIQREQIQHWYEVCKLQFPVYVDYWSKHRDVKQRTPIFQEKVFDIDYVLPSGRIVRLRGKWDSVDLIEDAPIGVYLQENKSKGDVDEKQLKRQLTFDLQTMMYLVALTEAGNIMDPIWKRYMGKIRGVRYNVIRRPLSGGRGTITRHKEKAPKKGKYVPEETHAHFYKRLLNDYIKKEPASYFMRWKVEVSKAEIEHFKTTCLNPILENLSWWYEEITGQGHQAWKPPPTHWRHPFGVFNILDEGGSSDLDEYLETGSTVGLERRKVLFEELEECQ